MKMHKQLVLKLSEIILDSAIQPRSRINNAVVKKYAEAMRQGSQFPPVVVYFNEGKYWLADGFHRLRSKQVNGEQEILAEVRLGSRRDAKLFAVEINVNHGNQRTNADKHRAVERLLRDRQWSCWSNREIAKRCGVNEKTVRNVKKQIQGGFPIKSNRGKSQKPSSNRLVQQSHKVIRINNQFSKEKEDRAYPHTGTLRIPS